MITVSKAMSKILAHLPKSEVEILPIVKINEKILAQDIVSERDQPPFHRMAMDGIAIDLSEYQNGRREFKIQDIQRAGQAQLTLNNKIDCIEGMTGGVLPNNATAVIRYEDVKIENGIAIVQDELVFNMLNNVHQKGSDHKAGEVVLKAGTLLRGPQIGIIAANGYAEVKVNKDIKIAVISTGDELVDLGNMPLDHQIRRSNPYALRSELNCSGFQHVQMFHLNDDKTHLYNELKTILKNHDVLVLSGGVSMGKFDFLPQIFADLQVTEIFHKVTQRPGKPLWFGVQSEKMIFGLPGNPVSAVTCLRRFVVPALVTQREGTACAQVYAKLTSEYEFNKALTYFCPVKVEVNSAGEFIATPIKTNGSGDYGSLAYSDGILELDKETNVFKAGTSHKVFMWGK